MKDIIRDNNLNISIKENGFNIDVPIEILENNKELLSSYIKIYTLIENLKKNITDYIFNKESNISVGTISKSILDLKNEEDLQNVLPYLESDIEAIEEKFKSICACFLITSEDIENYREVVVKEHVKESTLEGIVDEEYVNSIIDHMNNHSMYSLKNKSRYGSISDEFNVISQDNIKDFNEEEIDGAYSPILVIHRPAKYNRGQYILEDKYYVYIKRQPLKALIKQERLEEKGIDSVGAIVYKKLKHNLTNENLQEILAELYVYGEKNNIQFENLKLADITSNNVWMTADKLKKEFKELRYYHKNLTQRVREMYDTTGEYYTQISGKYVFNSRRFLDCYRAFKNRDINN